MTTAIAKRPKKLRDLLSEATVKSRFQEMLGKKSAGFISSIITVESGSKKLQEADPKSLIAAAAVAASLDLPIIPSLGLAYMVPYKGKATFQMGWRGYVQLGLRSGQYETINATVVYEGQILKHDPFTGDIEYQIEATSEKKVGYLLYFKLLNGFRKFFYWTKEECEAHGKKYSQTYGRSDGMWKKNFDAMALKTVVKNGLSKWGIMSIDMQTAVKMDQAAVNEDGTPDYIDGTGTATDDEIPDPKSAKKGAKKAAAPKPEPTNPEAGGETNGGRQDMRVGIERVAATTFGEEAQEGFKIVGSDETVFIAWDEAIANVARKAKEDKTRVKITFTKTDLGYEIDLIEAA